MNQAHVVIGSNLGDEGKGVYTDYFSTADSIVVRFNGGAQAGHTVQMPDGKRHVFGHFGAGTFRGAATYLSRFFAVHPMLFVKELNKLSGLLADAPIVYLDEAAAVTTPFDVMLNQAIENKRGAARHGSCGVGFGETIERSEKFGALNVIDLHDRAKLKDYLLSVRDSYVPDRAAVLGIDLSSMPYLYHDGIIDAFLANVDTMHVFTKTADQGELKGKRLVFEGAQGLGLDQHFGHFPHVTRSNCGLKNVIKMAQELEINKLTTTYVTRAYLTRHGAGPLSNEVAKLSGFSVDDKTNIDNEFQQKLRFAPLNIDELERRIMDDLVDSFFAGIHVCPQLAITCVDQLIPDQGELRVNNQLRRGLDRYELLEHIVGAVGFKHNFYSVGPTRADVLRYHQAVKVY